MNTKLLLKTSLLAACCYVISPVMASTADGETPAVESVCDGLDGALKGLCNSYCEALDCDSDNPHASETACQKVAANFAKHSDGAPLPCEQVECPCFDASTFSLIDLNSVDSCEVSRENNFGFIDAGRSNYELDATVNNQTGVGNCVLNNYETQEYVNKNDLNAEEVEACINIFDNFCHPN